METIQEGQSREDGLGGKRWGTSAEEGPHAQLWVLGLKVSWMNKAASVGSKKASVFSTHIIQRGWTGCEAKLEMSGSCQSCLIHFSRPGLPTLSPRGMFSFLDFLRLSHFGL